MLATIIHNKNISLIQLRNRAYQSRALELNQNEKERCEKKEIL